MIRFAKKKLRKYGSVVFPTEWIKETNLKSGDQIHFCKDWRGITFLLTNYLPDNAHFRYEYSRSEKQLTEIHENIDLLWEDGPSRNLIIRAIEIIKNCIGKEDLLYTHVDMGGKYHKPDPVGRYIELWFSIGDNLLELIKVATRQNSGILTLCDILMDQHPTAKIYDFLPKIWEKKAEDNLKND